MIFKEFSILFYFIPISVFFGMKRINSVILFYRSKSSSNRINDGVEHKQGSLASRWHQFQQYPSNTHTLTTHTVNKTTTGFITSIWTRSSKLLELFKLCIATRNNDAN